MSNTTNEVILERLASLTILVNEKFESQKNLFDEKFSANTKEHKSVITHQKLTNGRVTKLENRADNGKSWRDLVTGGLIILNIVVLPIAFIYIKKSI